MAQTIPAKTVMPPGIYYKQPGIYEDTCTSLKLRHGSGPDTSSGMCDDLFYFAEPQARLWAGQVEP